MGEIWRDIPGYVGLYKVSDQGRVHSLRRNIMLKPRTMPNGYLSVALFKSGQSKTFGVHRLVGLAFIPNPEGKPQINHKNGIKTDNHALNLEWTTHSENQRHRYNVLNKRKTTGKPVVCIETGAEYQTATEAAKVLNLCRSAITNCCLGKRTHTGGLHFKFKEDNNHVN